MAQMIVTKSDNQVIIRSPGPQGPQGATGNVLEGIGADESVMIADSGEGEGIRWAQVGDANVSALSPSKVTGTALVASSVDAKGDLLAATGADSVGRLPVGADGEVLVADSGEASGIGWQSLAEADVARASQVGNLLTENVATGTDALGTTEGFGLQHCTGESSTDYALQGSKSLKVTANTATAIINITMGGKSGVNGGAIPVIAGTTYTFTINLRAPVVTNQMYVRIYWYQADGDTPASTAYSDGPLLTLADEWRLGTVTGIAPGDAVLASVKVIRVTNFTTGDVLYVDKLGFWRGLGGSWAPPGVPITGLQSRAYVSSTANVSLSPAQPVVAATGGSVTYTLPTASGNTGVKFTVINSGTGTVTVSGITGLTIPGKGQVEVISTGSGWLVLSGRYSTNTVGLATYEWNHASNNWRLIAYDSGWRGLSAETLLNGWTVVSGVFEVRRTLDAVFVNALFNGTSASADGVYALPVGFRPTSTWRFPAVSSANEPTSAMIVASTGNIAVITDRFAQVRVATAVGASTTLPTSLPGTQVTAPA